MVALKLQQFKYGPKIFLQLPLAPSISYAFAGHMTVPPHGGGGGWHKASVSDCLPLAASIGPSPLLILTLCGPERVLVLSTKPPDDLSCLTTPGVGCPGDGAVARAVDQVHPDAHSVSMLGLPTPALT